MSVVKKLNAFEAMNMPRHQRRALAKFNGVKRIPGVQNHSKVEKKGLIDTTFAKNVIDSILNIGQKKEVET